MFKTAIAAALLPLVLAGSAQAQGFAPMPSGPFPDAGTFCAPFKPCQPDHVTRRQG